MKSQDLLGIFFAIGITVIAVGIAFTGETITENNPSVTNSADFNSQKLTNSQQSDAALSRGSVIAQGIGSGGIVNVDGESIHVEFVSGNEVNLDDSNGFIRAKITYNGYLQKMGKITLGVFSTNTGEFLKKSEIKLSLFSENVWVSDVMHRFEKQDFIDNPDLLGTYLLRIDTENGSLSKKVPFTVLMPSVKPVVEVAAVSGVPANPNVSATTSENTVEVTTSANSFNLSDLEPLFKDKVGKTYLAKILKEYYAKNLSKEEFVHLKSFDDLDCSVTFQDTDNGEEIVLSCNLKSE